jgi:Ras-related protein Rab-7A
LTITQSLFMRSTIPAPATPPTPPLPELPNPERRPKLFFTSAKTGEGVNDVFEYIARRVIIRWEWETREREQYGDEWVDDNTVSVGLNTGRGRRQRGTETRGNGEADGWGMKIARGCCAS